MCSEGEGLNLRKFTTRLEVGKIMIYLLVPVAVWAACTNREYVKSIGSKVSLNEEEHQNK